MPITAKENPRGVAENIVMPMFLRTAPKESDVCDGDMHEGSLWLIDVQSRRR